jgi:hypothetical protein
MRRAAAFQITVEANNEFVQLTRPVNWPIFII